MSIWDVSPAVQHYTVEADNLEEARRKAGEQLRLNTALTITKRLPPLDPEPSKEDK